MSDDPALTALLLRQDQLAAKRNPPAAEMRSDRFENALRRLLAMTERCAPVVQYGIVALRALENAPERRVTDRRWTIGSFRDRADQTIISRVIERRMVMPETSREECRSCYGTGIGGNDVDGVFRSSGACWRCSGLGFVEVTRPVAAIISKER